MPLGPVAEQRGVSFSGVAMAKGDGDVAVGLARIGVPSAPEPAVSSSGTVFSGDTVDVAVGSRGSCDDDRTSVRFTIACRVKPSVEGPCRIQTRPVRPTFPPQEVARVPPNGLCLHVP